MVDAEIVGDLLAYINQYTNDLKRMQGLSKREYGDDMVTRRAVERTFVNLIQACIDLAKHIRSTEGLSPSGTSKREIEALESAEIISSETREHIEEAVGFRNLLTHRYGEIDHEVVYEILQNDLRWFERFQQEVARWYQQHRS
jgi:uncharacterized protein YutE (UPF0331/DUF86 family)